MQGLDLGEVRRQWCAEGGGQYSRPVFGAVAAPDHDLPVAEVDVLDPKRDALPEAHAGAVDEGGYPPFRAREVRYQCPHLLGRVNDGQALGLFGALNIALPRLRENVAVEEQGGGESLVPCR